MTPAAAQALRIAIVRQRYNPYGGAERFVERALEALAAEGADVSLITRDWQGAPRENFHQITCDPAYSRLGSARVARDRSFSVAVQEALAASHFDIVQSHERIPGCSIFRAGDGVHAAWLDHRARALSAWRRLGQKLSAYHRYVLAAEKQMFADARLRAVVCNSQMVADEVAAYYQVPRDKLEVIYNGVDTELFQPDAVRVFRAETRRGLGIAADVPVLLFVGSGFERKGLPQLLKAMAAMHRKDANLIVVGGDRKFQSMRRLALHLGLKNRVHLIGPQKDVRPYYGAADAFVLPTLYDPCPNAALEALACGLPMVTSTTCGAREWVVQGENGWVVDALDEASLTLHLDDLCDLALTDPARDAARRAVENLTLPAMAERLLALYQRLAAAKTV